MDRLRDVIRVHNIWPIFITTRNGWIAVLRVFGQHRHPFWVLYNHSCWIALVKHSLYWMSWASFSIPKSHFRALVIRRHLILVGLDGLVENLFYLRFFGLLCVLPHHRIFQMFGFVLLDLLESLKISCFLLNIFFSYPWRCKPFMAVIGIQLIGFTEIPWGYLQRAHFCMGVDHRNLVRGRSWDDSRVF